MAFFNKKDKKKVDSKDRFKKRDDDESNNKKKFDNKPPTSDEEDDEDRGKSFKNKFKKNGDDDKDRDDKGRDKDKDKDRFGKKKKGDDQDVTKDFDRDGDDTEKTDVDKKRGDEVEGDEDEKGKGKKEKGGCNCGRQIEVNPPLRTQYEAIAALPPSLQADAVAVLAEQETEKILSSLAEKAENHDVDFDVLFQVFKRGWFSGRGSDHLTEAEIGFNRVNSWLAGGLARRLDADLVEDMGINTPSDDMVCDRDEPTPGEKLKNRLRKKRK